MTYYLQILHRNKEPHSGGTLWNKTLEGSTCTGGASNAGHTALVPTSLSNLGEQNNSLDRLKTENSNLRSTLEQVLYIILYYIILYYIILYYIILYYIILYYIILYYIILYYIILYYIILYYIILYYIILY